MGWHFQPNQQKGWVWVGSIHAPFPMNMLIEPQEEVSNFLVNVDHYLSSF